MLLKYSDGDLVITLKENGEILFSNSASKLNEVQVGKLFDRFFTVEAARSSAGLGLSIVKTLVDGTVPNYKSMGVDSEIAPWRASVVHSKITDVLVGDGITGFGEQAFYGMNLSSIYFGHDVITYDYAVGGSMSVKTAYIPSAMKDIRLFLADSYHKGYQMKIYYEGSKAEWEAIVKDSQGEYREYIINFNFEY